MPSLGFTLLRHHRLSERRYEIHHRLHLFTYGLFRSLDLSAVLIVARGYFMRLLVCIYLNVIILTCKLLHFNRLVEVSLRWHMLYQDDFVLAAPLKVYLLLFGAILYIFERYW